MSAFLIMIFLPSAKDLIAFHSSRERLKYLISALGSSNNSILTWLKKTSGQGWPWGGCHLDFRLNTGTSLKFSDSSLKCHFKPIFPQNPLKSLLTSDWFSFFWIGAKSRPFSKTLISVLVSTRLLTLKMVSEQKCPDNLLTAVVTLFFWCIKVSNLFLCTLGLTEASSEVLRNSFKIFKTSLSSSYNPSDVVTLIEEFCMTDVSVQRLGRDGGLSEKELSSASLT